MPLCCTLQMTSRSVFTRRMTRVAGRRSVTSPLQMFTNRYNVFVLFIWANPCVHEPQTHTLCYIRELIDVFETTTNRITGRTVERAVAASLLSELKRGIPSNCLHALILTVTASIFQLRYFNTFRDTQNICITAAQRGIHLKYFFVLVILSPVRHRVQNAAVSQCGDRETRHRLPAAEEEEGRRLQRPKTVHLYTTGPRSVSVPGNVKN